MLQSNTPSILLVPAFEADFEELVKVRIEAMRESLERVGRFDPVRARERFRSGFSPIHTWHVIVDGQQVGFVVVKDADNGQLLLDHLYIRPRFQKKGIGAAVLEQVFSEADARSVPIRVGVLRESGANLFYQRHGFKYFAEEEWDIYYVRNPQ